MKERELVASDERAEKNLSFQCDVVATGIGCKPGPEVPTPLLCPAAMPRRSQTMQVFHQPEGHPQRRAQRCQLQLGAFQFGIDLVCLELERTTLCPTLRDLLAEQPLVMKQRHNIQDKGAWARGEELLSNSTLQIKGKASALSCSVGWHQAVGYQVILVGCVSEDALQELHHLSILTHQHFRWFFMSSIWRWQELNLKYFADKKKPLTQSYSPIINPPDSRKSGM